MRKGRETHSNRMRLCNCLVYYTEHKLSVVVLLLLLTSPTNLCNTFSMSTHVELPEKHGMQIVENQTLSFSLSCCKLATAAGDYKPHLGYFHVYGGAFSKTSLQTRNSKHHVMIYLSANCDDDLLT
jgi:hypothetical protein